LGARKDFHGKPFLHLALPDGRGYLLPQNARRAAVQALSLYAPQKPQARLAKGLLTLGLKTGIARYLLPEIRLNLDELEGMLEKVFGRRDLLLAVSLGTPGPHRKPVVQVLTEDGRVLGYVKVGWNEATKGLVWNEARTLEALQKQDLPFEIPRLLYFGEVGGKVLCIQGPPPSDARPARGRLTAEYVKALRALAETGVQWRPLQETAFWQQIVDRIQRVKSVYWRHLLLKAVDAVKEQWKGEEVPLHFAHGDFAPWNAFQVNSGLYLYDWEYAQKEAPSGYDIFHFQVQKLLLVIGLNPQKILDSVLHLSDGCVDQYWKTIGAKESSVPELFQLYLLYRLAFCLTTNGSPAPQKDKLSLTLFRLIELSLEAKT